MKKRLIYLPLVLLVSCTNSIYHVSSLQSEQVKLVGKDFAFENEHLKVVYDLWEKGGRMRFLLFNKTEQPIYIDWSKSFLVRNDSTIRYSQLPPLPKRASVDTVRYEYQNTFVEPYRTTSRADQLTEIQPQTFVAIADIPIRQTVLHKRTKEKAFEYTKENSPLRIEHQLAYSFDKTMTNAQIIGHSFWIDKIQVVRAGALDKLHGSLEKGQPNALYAVEKQGATARIVLITAVVATGTTLLLVDALFRNFSIGL